MITDKKHLFWDVVIEKLDIEVKRYILNLDGVRYKYIAKIPCNFATRMIP